jgi:hypothetical protein
MTTTDAILERVRSADPVGDIDVRQWSDSEDAQRVLDRIVGGNVVALRSSRRRRTLWIGATVVVTSALATAAAAASGLLGEPAPDPIRADLAAVDEGLPEDLRANPDVENAMAVASTANAVLYAADVKDGGYCYEIATEGDRPRGAVCVTASRLDDRAIEITAPIPPDDAAPLLVGGHINDGRVERIVARYSNGTSVDVELGLSGYWLLEVPEGARDVALTDGLEIVGVGSDGQDVATVAVPPLRDDEPDGARDAAQPIFVSTISSEHDLTLVLGLEGSVNVADAATLELHYPDGTISPITLAADRSYRFILPDDRQSDFANAFGQLVARDADGTTVATTSFSSVANYRRDG